MQDDEPVLQKNVTDDNRETSTPNSSESSDGSTDEEGDKFQEDILAKEIEAESKKNYNAEAFVLAMDNLLLRSNTTSENITDKDKSDFINKLQEFDSAQLTYIINNAKSPLLQTLARNILRETSREKPSQEAINFTTKTMNKKFLHKEDIDKLNEFQPNDLKYIIRNSESNFIQSLAYNVLKEKEKSK